MLCKGDGMNTMGANNRNGNRENGFILNEVTGYFQNKGVDVMAFDDFYPDGHQGGVSIIMHGNRIASNGDLRFERMPGGWSPIPKQGERKLDFAANSVTTSLSYPDLSETDGENPTVYPDIQFDYKVVTRGEGPSIAVTVDLDKPIPEDFAGKVWFNLELFPGALIGKTWIMDGKQGIFPEQANGPVLSADAYASGAGAYTGSDEGKSCAGSTGGVGGADGVGEAGGVGRSGGSSGMGGDVSIGGAPVDAGGVVAVPYAVGKRFIIRPDDPYNKLTIETDGSELKFYDGRMYTNNGWFIVAGEVPAGKTKNAVRWIITPNVVDDWIYPPVVQTSQVGYHPMQAKTAIIELDSRETTREIPALYRITETGAEQVFSAGTLEWGRFLRYNYVKFDFSDIKDEGLYQIRYGASESPVFRIAADVYDRGVWQPVLEYFLPVQMCHMRVNEKYRVWHGLCHEDDAKMAPVNHNHLDGYAQGPTTLTKYKPGEVVPGLDIGGWHDAGDDDLRIESQAGEVYILAMAYENFGVDYDTTSIDQHSRIVEIHQPDGKNDILQQIEHGVLSVIGAYYSLGRFYRGMISNNQRQYVIIGDTASMTDGIKGNDDDRWVFTEENPPRELTAAAHMAAAARVLKGFNDALSEQALQAAREVFAATDISKDTDLYKTADDIGRAKASKLHAAAELFLTTGEDKYKNYILSETAFIAGAPDMTGWFLGRVEKVVNDAGLTAAIRGALPSLQEQFAKQGASTPYGAFTVSVIYI